MVGLPAAHLGVANEPCRHIMIVEVRSRLLDYGSTLLRGLRWLEDMSGRTEASLRFYSDQISQCLALP